MCLSCSIPITLPNQQAHPLMLGKVNPQCPARRLLIQEDLLRFLSRLDIEEFRVRKTADLSRPAVHGDTHVQNVFNVLEDVLQVTIREFVRNSPNEEGVGWVFLDTVFMNLAASVLQDDLASFQDPIVQVLDGIPSAINRGEFTVAEPRFVAR